MAAGDAAVRAGLTRAQLLARGGGVGLALLGAGRPLGLGGDVDALAATAAPPQARHFVSRPDLRPPVLTVRHRARGTSPGYLFIAPSSGPGQRGALIFDETGEPVWFHPVTPVTATAFRASTLRGKPVLTWWEGTYSNEGLGRGVYVVVDDSYRQVARIHAGGYRDGDLHEFLLTDEGTALVTKNEAVRQNLSAYGGAADGLLYGGVVQEIAVPSGRVLFEWRSLDHVELSESHARPNENHFDYFHVNSVDVDHDGHLLVSARNTWAVYKVHRRTGEILWRLGGRKSDFAMGPGTITAWQHDARSHDRGRLISIFDNGAAPQVQTQSRGLLVRLDTERMRATLVRTFKHRPNRIVSKFMGSVQLLPDGGAVMGWGSEPFVTEFDRAGRIRFEALLPDGGQNYRAFRFPWIATPVAPPVLSAGVVRRRRGLFASWNGSTEVRAWQLRYGATAGDLQDGGATPRSGFETFLERPPGTRFAQVIALDAKSRPIGRSRVGRL
jgi:hypothetical protein